MIARILIFLIVIILDLICYLFLGLALMNYDDFYDESEGPYWSWESMNISERLVVVAHQAWIIVNVILVLFLAYKAYKYIKQ